MKEQRINDPYLERLIKDYAEIEEEKLIIACYNNHIRKVAIYQRPQNIMESAYQQTVTHYERLRKNKNNDPSV